MAPSASAAPLNRIAYERISAAIVQGRLDFGEPLSEVELAKALGISKAPVRSAMSQLALEGLVEVVPRSGSYVASPTAARIAALCDFRLTLESSALETAMLRDPSGLTERLRGIVEEMTAAFAARDLRALKRLDTAFHQAFIDGADNRYLTEAYRAIALIVEALRYRFLDTTAFRNQAFDEHGRMVDLIAAGRTREALRCLAGHIQRTKQFQTAVPWSDGRATRRAYRQRDYAALLSNGGPGLD